MSGVTGERWEEAIEVLRLMQELYVFEDLITMNSALKACEAHHWQGALQLLDRLEDLRLRKDVASAAV